MYSTAKEVHIAIQSGLNQIDSDRKRTFRPEEIDYAFNTAMFKYIEERSVIQPSPNGLFETVKRIDDLSDITVTDAVEPIYFDGVNKYFLIKPIDYYKFQDLAVEVNYDCNERDIIYLDRMVVLNILPFNEPQNASDYSTFELKLSNGQSIYKASDYNITNLHNVDSKFTIVNSVLENLPYHRTTAVSPSYNIYWETYGFFKYDNCFIIETTFNTPAFFELVMGTVTEVSSVYEVTLKIPEIQTDYISRPTEILNTKYKNNVLSNYYYNKNRHLQPFIYFQNNTIFVEAVKNALYRGAFITYIKKPVLLNLKSNIMTDFKSHISEIIDMTITNLSLTLLGSAEANAAISNNNRQ